MSGPSQPTQALKTQPPALPPALVERAWLSRRLTVGATGPVTLVCAGPGAGKTSAVGAWFAAGLHAGPIGWLSLDAADNDLRTFWSDLIAAVVNSGGVPADSPLRDISPAPEFGAAEVREVRARLAEIPAPIVLVLDDFHEIADDGVLTTFGGLVDHLPVALRLLIVSRSDPDLRLHRLRVNGQLTEIRTGDLAFTESETAELFDNAGIHLMPGQATALTERTEGWPAGLRLAAMSLDPADTAAGIDRFSGSNQSVADYLVSEVTRRLSPADLDFLLWTSVVDRISGSLADAITGRADSQLLLEQLMRTNAFVVGLGAGQEWFRYHPLLRELMLHRLHLEQPNAEPGLHLRAARWLSTAGQPIVAIRHLILAGEEEAAGRAMVLMSPRVVSPEGPALVTAIAPLADAAVDHPSLFTLLAAATRHFHRHEFGAMHHDAVRARGYLDQADGVARASAEAMVLLYEMTYARIRADTPETAELATRVIELVDRTPRAGMPPGRAFRSIAQGNLGGAQLWNGRLDDAEEILGTAATEASALGLLLAQLNATGHLAVIEAMRGRFRAAERRAGQALLVIERRGWGSEPQSLATFLALALVHLARQKPGAADTFVRRGLAASGNETDRALRLALAVAAVQVAVSRGDAVAAMSAAARADAGFLRTPDAGGLLTGWAAVTASEALLLAGRPREVFTRIEVPAAEVHFLSSWQRVCLARASYAVGDYAQAGQLVEPVLTAAVPYRESVVAANLISAMSSDRRQRDIQALTALTSGIDLAQPDGIVRPFLQTGGRLPDLLRRYRQLGGRHDAFAEEILQQLSPDPLPSDSPHLLVEHLTERETIVLQYLPTMLKAGEIADELFVSVNTVKAHLRAIYRKLGVVNRRDAVDKAKLVGLL